MIEFGWEAVDELFVCDDCSSDRTYETIKAIPFDRCKLRLLRHERNMGEAATYKTMTDLVSPAVEWLLILHGDDIALSNFLTRNLEIISKCSDDVAAVSSNYYAFNSMGINLAHSPAVDEIVFRGSSPHDISHTAHVGTWWHISGSLVRARHWVKFGGRDGAFPQLGDWDLMLRWQSSGLRIGHSLIPTTQYRISEPASLSSVSYKTFRDVKERAEIINRHPSIFTRISRIKLSTWLSAVVVRRIGVLLLKRGDLSVLRHGMRALRASVAMSFR
jgi:glycosyltransferase involved in cell wall biosynthesis